MKRYEAPTISEMGSVSEVTQGQGWRGTHDQRSFVGGRLTVTWGENPNPTS
jgi:hypothetical protein